MSTLISTPKLPDSWRRLPAPAKQKPRNALRATLAVVRARKAETQEAETQEAEAPQ